jgi:hypothetical protein
MKILIGFAALLFAVQAQATQIPFRDLTNLVSDADHVFIGTVEKVDMVDAKGSQVTTETARTGPGSENQLRLHVTVATNQVIASSAKVPVKIVIPLWQRWHDTLGNRRKEVQGKTFIFLLKGKDLAPVYHGFFMRKPSERAEIEAILKRKKTQNK